MHGRAVSKNTQKSRENLFTTQQKPLVKDHFRKLNNILKTAPNQNPRIILALGKKRKQSEICVFAE